MPAMGLIMIDLDGFKQVNDERGHLTGDLLLQGVAATLLSATRPGDIVVRWGGDEFIVLCPGADDGELTILADRLLDAIASVEVDGVSARASAGLQTCSRRPLPLDRADSALYAAKAAGGGRSVAAGRS
jgi:diguanylate cyclase (GGDEF)-like protein